MKVSKWLWRWRHRHQLRSLEMLKWYVPEKRNLIVIVLGRRGDTVIYEVYEHAEDEPVEELGWIEVGSSFE